jgi:hypothetical protein
MRGSFYARQLHNSATMHALRSQRFHNGTSLAESSSGLRALATQPLKT